MIRRLVFLIFLPFCSCVQTENSNSLDADTYGSAESIAIRTLFKQNCTPCHSFHSMTTDALVAAGQLVRRSPATSKIYYRLTGSSGIRGPKNMPNGGTLSVNELAQVEAWILGL